MPPSSKPFVSAASVAPLPLSKHQYHACPHAQSQLRKRSRSSPSETSDEGDEDEGSDGPANKPQPDLITAASPEPPRKKATKPRRRNTITATIEIRELRENVAHLDATLNALVHKWQTRIPDRNLWSVAYEAARQKWCTAQVEASHKQLNEQLTAQLLHMSTLQSLLPQSPLFAYPSSMDLFGALHTPLHLRDVSDAERIEQLGVRGDASLRLAPSLVDKFTAKHTNEVSVAVPFARSNISADATFTYQSTIFIVRIPRVPVKRVIDAVLNYCETVNAELERRYKLTHELQDIHSPSRLHKYRQLRYTSPTSFTSRSNLAFAAKVGEDSGVVVVDFVDRDDRFPEASEREATRRDVSFMIYVTPTMDPVTKQPQVLLRQVCVNRFNMRPDEELLREEVQLTQMWSNGDLLVALVCQYLMENQ